MDHGRYMRRAIEIAHRKPDAPFGCVNDAEKNPSQEGAGQEKEARRGWDEAPSGES